MITFVSFKYIAFLLIVAFLYYLMPKKVRWVVLLIASYTYYFIASHKLTLFLLLTTMIIYGIGYLLNLLNVKIKSIPKSLDKELRKAKKKRLKSRKRNVVIVGVILTISSLLFLKYFSFFAGNFNAIGQFLHLPIDIPLKKFVLPLGISYYTLMGISYIVDVYRGKYPACLHPGKLALYLSFFPQMVEGPISRFDQTADQLFRGNRLEFKNIRYAAYLILWGVFKKMVVADRAAVFVNAIFGTEIGGISVIIAIVLYTLQIYAEFSAAIDIVRGTGYLFGVYLPQNFRQPFFSKSIAEFWQRWHITLGSWLKDYVFISVSLSKMNVSLNKFTKKYLKGHLGRFVLTAFPLFFVWFFNGFWHGATWKYIFYGLYYYTIMMAAKLVEPWILPYTSKLQKMKWYHFFQIMRTIIIVMIGMLIFRADTLTNAWQMVQNIFHQPAGDIFSYGLLKVDFYVLIFTTLMIFILGLIQEKGNRVRILLERKPIIIRYAIILFIIAMIIVFGMYGEGYDASDFIYGGF